MPADILRQLLLFLHQLLHIVLSKIPMAQIIKFLDRFNGFGFAYGNKYNFVFFSW
jgi:hypothetical protein